MHSAARTALYLFSLIGIAVCTQTAALAANSASENEWILTPASVDRSPPTPKELLARPGVRTAEYVFGAPERVALTQLGDFALAQSIRLKTWDRPELKNVQNLKSWIHSRCAGCSLDLNSAARPKTLSSAPSHPQDPWYPLQWGLENTGKPQRTAFDEITTLWVPGKKGEDIGLTRATSLEVGPLKPVLVAVLDSGVDGEHPDLLPRMVDQVFTEKKREECTNLAAYLKCKTNPRNIPQCDAQYLKLDADGNGYPLDCRGWNVAPTDPKTGERLPPSPITGVAGDANTSDEISHGTHVAGIIAAVRNSIGVAGVATNAAILPVRVIRGNPNPPIRPQAWDPELPDARDDSLKASGAFADVVARGVLYALRSGADILNLSLSWNPQSDTELMRRMIALANARGAIVIASAGNDATHALTYPCAYSGVICVASHGPDGAISHFSNFGPAVDLAAPGMAILSTFPVTVKGRDAPQEDIFTAQPGYDYKSGTSMAAPMVSGLAARILGLGLSPAETKARLLISGREVQLSQFGIRSWLRGGNVDLANALSAEPSALIVPANKSAIRISKLPNDSAAELRFSIQNLWRSSGQIRLQASLESSGDGTTLPTLSETRFELDSLESGATHELSVELRDFTRATSGRFELVVQAESTNLGVKQLHVLRYPIEISTPVQEKALDQLGAYRLPISGEFAFEPTSFRTLSRLSRQDEPDYLLQALDGDQWVIQWMERVAAGYQLHPPAKFANPLPGPNDRLLKAMILDQDADGTEEIVLLLELRPKASSRQLYKFMALDPKTGAQKFVWEHINDYVRLSDRFSWIRMGTGELRPGWVGVGRVPKLERPGFDPWNPTPDDPLAFRFYYLAQDGLRTLSAPEGWTPIAPLQASDSDRASGTLPLLLSRGDGFELEYSMSSVSRGVITSARDIGMSAYRNLMSSANVTEILQLERGKDSSIAGTSLTGASVGGSLRSTWITDRGVIADRRLDPIHKTDSVVQVIGAFSGKRGGIFSQTHSEIQFNPISSEEVAATSVRRYSFLPSFVVSNSVTPVIVGSSARESGATPGIWVADGLGDTPSAEILVPQWDSRGKLSGISRPAHLRLTLGSDCPMSLNPRVSGVSGQASEAVLLCRSSMVRIPLTQ